MSLHPTVSHHKHSNRSSTCKGIYLVWQEDAGLGWKTAQFYYDQDMEFNKG